MKHSLGKLTLPAAADRFVTDQRKRHGIHSLPLQESEVMHLINLPMLHRDPFDRMLIGQAVVGELTILTPDQTIRQYPVKTIW